MAEIALIGNGYLGQAYHRIFPEAVVYDEPVIKQEAAKHGQVQRIAIESGRRAVNQCDIAIIAVPTDPLESDELDMSIVEDVVDWVETDTILIKSALMPGTVDRLVEKTGKNIAVSVEMIGTGGYYVPNHKYPDPNNPEKHDLLIVGGEEPARSNAANVLWSKMSPDINIHLTTAVEAEIVKLMENTWGAYKVSFANIIYDICEDLGANYINVLQAWGADGRVEKMHMRTMPGKRGWKSHCYSKDVPALATLDKSGLLSKLIEVNEGHLEENNP